MYESPDPALVQKHYGKVKIAIDSNYQSNEQESIKSTSNHEIMQLLVKSY